MELKLQKADHEYYETLRFAPFPCETMRENIVPDSCGDIARIVDTTGTVCLTGRELTGDGRFCASGSVEASVLYIPEKEEMTIFLPVREEEKYEDTVVFRNGEMDAFLRQV